MEKYLPNFMPKSKRKLRRKFLSLNSRLVTSLSRQPSVWQRNMLQKIRHRKLRFKYNDCNEKNIICIRVAHMCLEVMSVVRDDTRVGNVGDVIIFS